MRTKVKTFIFLAVCLGFSCSIVFGLEETRFPECEYLHTLSSPEPQASGNFGSSCVIINETIVIGEPARHADPPRAGTVWFFNLKGNVTKSIKSPFKANSSGFGFALTANDDVLVISEPNLSDDETHSGMVHYYTLEGEYLKSVSSKEPTEKGAFGLSLACNDDIILVGEPGVLYEDENITSRVYAYDNSGNHLYTLHQPEVRTGNFGQSVAVNNETIVVGESYYSDKFPSWQGIIHVYSLNGSLIRSQTSPFHMTSNRPRNFGAIVSSSDTIYSVGEPRGNVDEQEYAGRAYIYDRKGKVLANLTSLQRGMHFGYLLVRNDLTLVEDYVKMENVTGRVGAVIYDKHGEIKAIVPYRDNDYTKGFPKTFTEDYIILGDPWASAEGRQYAGRVLLFSVPEEIWAIEENVKSPNYWTPIIASVGLVLGVILYSRIRVKYRD